MKRLFLSILALTFFHLAQAQTGQLEIPKVQPGQHVTRHTGYALLYDEVSEQASWVAYQLTAEEVSGSIGRTDNFRADHSISTGSAQLDDYRGSGYDRGHLIPAADASWSSAAMSATFYLSNMSPQDPSFNRGGWKKLEEQVRSWAQEDGSIYVVTGPALKQGAKQWIGPDHVAVPRYYYKVILDNQKPEIKAIGFIMPNQKITHDLSYYAVSVDSVESFTGLDFYPALPDNQEEHLESHLNKSLWHFGSSSTHHYHKKKSTAVRCHGITKKGTRCKRRTTNENGYCWQHQGQANGSSTNTYKSSSHSSSSNAKRSVAVRCHGHTKKGTRCKRKTKNANGYCWQHQSQAGGH